MSNEKLLFQTDEFGFAKSSLMLLESNENFLDRKIEQHGSLPKYLRYLIKRYQINLKDNFPLEFRNTKKYQTRGVDYTRIKFEVDGNTWMGYQLLAFYFRVSISYLFALLLSLDAENGEVSVKLDNKSFVTVFSKQIQLKLKLFLDHTQKHDYECLLELKI